MNENERGVEWIGGDNAELLIIQFVYLNKQEDESVWRTCQQNVDSQWNQPFP